MQVGRLRPRTGYAHGLPCLPAPDCSRLRRSDGCGYTRARVRRGSALRLLRLANDAFPDNLQVGFT